jgi:hypothetical protein
MLDKYPELTGKVLTLGTDFTKVDFTKPLVIVGLDTIANIGSSSEMRDINPTQVQIKHQTLFSGSLSLDFHSLKDENMLAYTHAVYFCNAIKTKKVREFFIDNPAAKQFSIKQADKILNLNEISGANHIARFLVKFNVVFWEEMEEDVLGCTAKDILKINYQE